MLCLVGGGGQQSAAFALLEATVTVVDLSEEQLQRDREVAAHYQVNIQTLQGDMRDLALFPSQGLFIVWQPYSLNFVPDAHLVFHEVARVLRREGLYHFNCANAFVSGLTEQDWNGEGCLLKHSYRDGAEIVYLDSSGIYESSESLPRPREYRHTLSTLVNGLIAQGFVIRNVSDNTDSYPDPNAEPGTWGHFIYIAPPWLTFWASYRPHILEKANLL